MSAPTTSKKALFATLVALVALACLLAAFAIAQCASSDAQRSGANGSNGNAGAASEMPLATNDTAAPLDPITITYFAVGDIVCHKEMIQHSRSGEAGGYDFTNVFLPIANRFGNYDILAVTQETPLVSNEGQVGGYPVFGTPVQMADALANAGFDIVVSATNHSLDQGAEGVLETIAYWKAHHPEITLLGIHDDPASANGVSIVECKGIKIALTDCTYGLNGFELPEGCEYEVDLLDDLETIATNVEAVQDQVDLTICYVHMGEEYATVPSDEQRYVAECLIDAGADVVLGSHVHVVQPMETVTTPAGNTGIVYFSLGNFASNQANVENMLGGAAVLQITKTFDSEGGSATAVTSHDYVPVFCHYDYETTQMYFLDEYTDELANNHFITLYGHPFTVDEVWSIWTNITGLPRP